MLNNDALDLSRSDNALPVSTLEAKSFRTVLEVSFFQLKLFKFLFQICIHDRLLRKIDRHTVQRSNQVSKWVVIDVIFCDKDYLQLLIILSLLEFLSLNLFFLDFLLDFIFFQFRLLFFLASIISLLHSDNISFY